MDAIRPPAVAGMFYETNPAALQEQLRGLFEDALKRQIPEERDTRAIILPHAAYVFSGKVAASGVKQLPPDARFSTIFLIGASHRYSFEGAALYRGKGFETPLGVVETDHEVCDQLLEASSLFTANEDVHEKEHGLEVQLPLLQHHLNHPFKIVPLLIGARQAATCRELAKIMQPWFHHDNLFVVSTDFSHYPDDVSARRIDAATTRAILSKQPTQLLSTLQQNQHDCNDRLGTSLCGWPAVLTLMYMCEHNDDCLFHQILYENSGDSPLGDKKKVVGYDAIAVSSSPKSSFQLNQREKDLLLQVARESIASIFTSRKRPLDPAELPMVLKVHTGAFVSIYRKGHLAGCIGHIGQDEPLWQVVQRVARAAATEDTRFRPLEHHEQKDIRIEISVLTPAHKIEDIGEIEPGRHGIIVKLGDKQGTFLPQVAARMNWNALEMLEHCARDKAKIGKNGWKDAELYIYEALVFASAPEKE